MFCARCASPRIVGALFCVACGFKNEPTQPAEDKLFLGRYEVITSIARGPFSTVYRGRDNRLGREVTLKVQNPEHAGNAQLMLHLQREGYLTASLPHPFAVTMYSTELLQDGRVLLIMEHLEGETLSERLALQGAFSIEESAAITGLMCGVLAYFHENKIAFGNLSLENVVLTKVPFEPEPLPKLCSFGVAAELTANQAHLPAWIQGKSSFIEEEQRGANIEQDLRDLVSFAYQLATGHTPPEEKKRWRRSSFMSLLDGVLYGEKGFDSALLLKEALFESAQLAAEEGQLEERPDATASQELVTPEISEAPQAEERPADEPPPEEKSPEAKSAEVKGEQEPEPQTEGQREEPKQEPELIKDSEPAPIEAAPAEEKKSPAEITHEEIKAAVDGSESPTEDKAEEPPAEPELRLANTVEEPDAERVALLSEEPSFEGELPNLDEVMLQLDQVAPTRPSYESMLAKANRLFQQKSYDDAFSAYQEILAIDYEEQTEDDLATLLHRLGIIRRDTGGEEKALLFFQKAHEIAPERRDILTDTLQLVEARNDWELFVFYQERLLNLLTEPDEKKRCLIILGLALQARLQDFERAEEYLTQAVDLEPSNWGNVRHLFLLFFETKQWAKAADTLQKLSTLTSDPAKRTALYFSLAAILYDELKQAPQAIDALNAALDDSWSNHKALQKLEGILLQRKDYQGLAENYHKMIRRLPPDETTWRVSIFQKLAEVYRDKLGDKALAMEFLEKALALDPQRQDAMASLTDLYATDPNQGPKAINLHRKKFDDTPDDVESLHSLWQLYLQQELFDKAFCVSSVLTFMQHANTEERSFHEQHRSKSLLTAHRLLDSDTFEDNIRSPKEDRYISGIFRVLSPYVASLYSQKEKSLGLKPKDKIDLTHSELMLPKRFQYVAKVLNISGLALYTKEDQPGFEYELLAQEKSYRPIATIGTGLLTGRTDKEIVFLCGKHLSYLRPEYFLIRALKSSYGTLRVVLFAAISMISPSAIPSSLEELAVIQQLASKLEKVIPPPALDQLEELVQGALSSGRRLSVSDWMNQVEYSANRVGFLLANDLESAYRVITAEKTKLSPLENKQKIQDLTRFAVSDGYFSLRKHFGFSI